MRARRQQLGEERNSEPGGGINEERGAGRATPRELPAAAVERASRSEEHTSELQSHSDLVCRLLLEKKKKRLQNHGVVYQIKKLIDPHDTSHLISSFLDKRDANNVLRLSDIASIHTRLHVHTARMVC